MGSEALEIRTNEALLAALRHASSLPSTAAQILEQRASYIYGSIKPDSSISKEQIREILAEQVGGIGARK